MNGVITLLTDFGWDDPYVAELKSALLEQWTRFPDLASPPTVVDLCHTLEPCDVVAAHWFLARLHAGFPHGTVHVAVVDPGVGTDRPLVAAAAHDQFFVAPGNGLLAFLHEAPDLEVVRLDNPLYHRVREGRGPAHTFHGRDIMSPVAAHLVLGIPLHQVGSPGLGEDLGRLPGVAVISTGEQQRLGTVVWIDRFGNAITDIARDTRDGETLAHGVSLVIGGTELSGPHSTYGLAPAGDPFWYWGSGDCLEAGLPGGHAAEQYGWRRGMAVLRAAP